MGTQQSKIQSTQPTQLRPQMVQPSLQHNIGPRSFESNNDQQNKLNSNSIRKNPIIPSEHEKCKNKCWNNIKEQLRKELYIEPYKVDNLNSLAMQLRSRNIMTIGCENCTIGCSNNCLTIAVCYEVNEFKSEMVYTIFIFYNKLDADKFLNASYPNGSSDYKSIDGYRNNLSLVAHSIKVKTTTEIYLFLEQLYTNTPNSFIYTYK